jgi:quercetin dioxygenase-like cupin family protein
MSERPEEPTTVVLADLADALIADLANRPSGHTARTIVSAARLRATLIAIQGGGELQEHDAPPAATLMVLKGDVVLKSGDREWPLTTGQLVEIPQARHSVSAHTDSALLLTVAID